MEREYVRGNKEHWKEVYKYVYGIVPEIKNDHILCSNDKGIFVRNKAGGLTFYTDEITYDAITTNPNWHEVKPWEKHYIPKPFDKVFGWNDNYPSDVRPDVFLCKCKSYEDGKTIYKCEFGCWDHVKPYNEDEYIKRVEEL